MDNPMYRTVYVENFNLDTTSETLNTLFRCFGEVKRIQLPQFEETHPLVKSANLKHLSKGFAFIEFATEQDSIKACAYFNDLKTIVRHHGRLNKEATVCDKSRLSQEQDNSSSRPPRDTKTTPAAASDKLDTLLAKPELEHMYLLRVIPKPDYLELVRQYKLKRSQSLIKAAALLLSL